MSLKYPITPALTKAFARLFDNLEVPLGIIGANDFDRDVDAPVVPLSEHAQQQVRDRLFQLRSRLEGYVLTMAEETEELPDDVKRLRAEAVGIAVCLRDLVFAFPEIFLDK